MFLILIMLMFFDIVKSNGFNRYNHDKLPIYYQKEKMPGYRTGINNLPAYKLDSQILPRYRPGYNSHENHHHNHYNHHNNPNYGNNYGNNYESNCQNYNSAFKLCCNGVLNDRIGLNPACCNFNVYDSTWNICCNGIIQKKTGLNPMCCGTQSYDSTFYQCCYGSIRSYC